MKLFKTLDFFKKPLRQNQNNLFSQITHTGMYNITVRNKLTKKIDYQDIIYNQITNVALDQLIKAFAGDFPYLEIKELAIGTGTTAPSITDTQMSNEVYRISETENGRVDVGQNLASFTLNGSEYTGNIYELGVFAGYSAEAWQSGAGKDSGILLSRVLWTYNLLSTQEIYFQRIDNIS